MKEWTISAVHSAMKNGELTCLELVQYYLERINKYDDKLHSIILINPNAEKEAAAETLLASKGFTDAVVSMTADSADVVIGQAELDDASLAQIEDIVTRKTGVPAQNVVITPVSAQTE